MRFVKHKEVKASASKGSIGDIVNIIVPDIAKNFLYAGYVPGNIITASTAPE
jgi:hypothetical protein